ncbi:F-actin-capping protein [Entophlyctis luteolus]|nr:F-actin-capping protein [Entophlyctis luteolus]KAJ3350321.1 F-actin-capping protein [Entophlyctis luteolus]KAJ3390242.1 F-actin-capping protein [Entophlyctis sp. JEL0112]
MSTAADPALTLASIAHFVSEAPPGELGEVINDIRVLVNNDEDLLADAIALPCAEYNLDSFAVIETAGGSKFVTTRHNQLEGGRFANPADGMSYVVDHVSQTSSDAMPLNDTGKSAIEDHRKALETAVAGYIDDHYPNGVSAVFSGEEKSLVIAIVNNKFNPSNFWNGRWIAEWTVALDSDEAKGVIRANVHYYEDGNVQLKTLKEITVKRNTTDSTTPSGFAASVVAAILKAETEYQLALNVSYGLISDTTFKYLRRALPITRTKLDWNSVSNYKIGAELSNK